MTNDQMKEIHNQEEGDDEGWIGRPDDDAKRDRNSI